MPIFSIIGTLIRNKKNNTNKYEYLTGNWINPLLELIIMGVGIVFIIFSTKYVSLTWTMILLAIYSAILTWYEIKKIGTFI